MRRGEGVMAVSVFFCLSSPLSSHLLSSPLLCLLFSYLSLSLPFLFSSPLFSPPLFSSPLFSSLLLSCHLFLILLLPLSLHLLPSPSLPFPSIFYSIMLSLPSSPALPSSFLSSPLLSSHLNPVPRFEGQVPRKPSRSFHMR